MQTTVAHLIIDEPTVSVLSTINKYIQTGRINPCYPDVFPAGGMIYGKTFPNFSLIVIGYKQSFVSGQAMDWLLGKTFRLSACIIKYMPGMYFVGSIFIKIAVDSRPHILNKIWQRILNSYSAKTAVFQQTAVFFLKTVASQKAKTFVVGLVGFFGRHIVVRRLQRLTQ